MSKGIWSTVDVPTMWVSAQAADTQMAWEQVGAWSRTHELLLFHESRLKTLQLELLAAWPPERSPAANAFVQHMEGLLTRVAHARHDAAKNRDALKLLLESLASARNDMAPIKRAWDEFEAQESNSPRFYKGQSWQEALNAKAQSRMERNDREVFEATRLLTVAGNSDDTTGQWEPYADDQVTERLSTWGAPSGSASAHPTSSSPLKSENFSDRPMDSGSQLAGIGAADPLAPTQTPSTQTHGPQPGRSPFNTDPSVPQAAALIGPSGSAGARPSGFASVPRPSSPSIYSNQPAAQGAGHAGGMRVNPVGGVISSTPGGVAGVPASRAIGASGSAESSRDPVLTMQWEVATGVPAVIEPPGEPPFALGPGVIGVDR